MTMNVLDRFGSDLRQELQEAFAPRDLTEFNHRPRMLFRLNKAFSKSSALTVFDLIVEFKQLSGTSLHPLSIRDGCVHIDALADRTTDRHDVDLRRLFLSSPDYYRFVRGFDIERLFFQSFPHIRESANHGVSFFFDDRGRPLTAFDGRQES